MIEQLPPGTRYGMRAEQFSDLMAYRVTEILLVASRYDSFVLEEDGQFTELTAQEARPSDVAFRDAPRFTTARTAAEALQLLSERPFGMVVTTARLSGMSVQEFGREAKSIRPGLPLGVLAAHAWETPLLEGLRESGAADWLFLWLGNVKSLLAMITQQEDRRNADHDVLERGVQAIIVVEDDIRFCSFFLPHTYTEVTHQTARLMAEGLNQSHRLLRMRARPKILLAQNYEEAWQLYEKYAGHILGVISDVSYPREGRLDPEAGAVLARRIRERDPELPILLQSSEDVNRALCEGVGVTFLHKESPRLLEELRAFILDNFGFGDFVFRLPDGSEIARARDLRQLLVELERVPNACIEYHAGRNHFSRWFTARTEFQLAHIVRPRTVAEFGSVSGLRDYIIQAATNYLREIQRSVITDFHTDRYDQFVAFSKIGSGSLGGKGRGLAFLQKLLSQERIEAGGIEATIPQTLVLASNLFEQFIESNDIRSIVQRAGGLTDGQILDEFRGGRFDRALRTQLAKFLEVVRDPIAVRSSSILEDSPYQPFAGVYATMMLPNNHPSLDVRLAQLLEAIKVVYASTYMKAARDYLLTTPYRIEEERMAILLQRLVGRRYGERFYPTFSGVASSHNFYPFGSIKPEDGVALVALGLGKSVVEGFEALRFCPASPQILPQFSSVKDILKNAQRRFWALNMSRNDIIPGLDLNATLLQLDVTDSVADGSSRLITSSYVPANDSITNGIVPGGVPIISFARVLRGQVFPLASILRQHLEAARRSMGIPVEIEFAADLNRDPDGPHSFHVLQIRPMVVERSMRQVALDGTIQKDAVVFTQRALGRGRSQPFHDVVVVTAGLDRSRTIDAAAALERINQGLRGENRPYVLIGPGRWGSRDPWLGIPVTWSQINMARAIVETDFADLEVEPSQGSHFFHNMTSFGVAFLTVPRRGDSEFINWTWLEAQKAAREELGGAIRHIHLDHPLRALVDGSTCHGAVVVDTPEG